MTNSTNSSRFHPFFKHYGKKRDDRQEGREGDKKRGRKDDRKDDQRKDKDEPRDERREFLRKTASDTRATLPRIASQYRTFNTQACTLYMLPVALVTNITAITNPPEIPPLDPSKCPGRRSPQSPASTAIRVVNGDTLDTALSINPTLTVNTILQSQSQATPIKPTLVLNLASDIHAGGGWHNGAMAQEEELCYRTTLSHSLHRYHYPLHPRSALYAPNVALFRDSFATGHKRLTETDAHKLPALSVVSVAALRKPELTKDFEDFADDVDRDVTMGKIRLVLRVAGAEGHTRLVLGALGCGVFRNPPKAVAKCFLEVFREPEFQGGWWEEVVFAVMDNAPQGEGGKDGKGNFGVFYRALDGVLV
ncbi:hypothetical protein DM02DRAFT_619799 [Periconia macrospinosa]|uniref:Microbial-type PARG catalytic domain-containing protein n=1 Tax=Periconia macrospinosa TaxID=97972 RepID=A0A2V1D619_9PLEO|nr:hypothetical protein DM02DRAFT_619799 [Periconia macrospinosa]